jgi:hypothetical protein
MNIKYGQSHTPNADIFEHRMNKTPTLHSTQDTDYPKSRSKTSHQTYNMPKAKFSVLSQINNQWNEINHLINTQSKKQDTQLKKKQIIPASSTPHTPHTHTQVYTPQHLPSSHSSTRRNRQPTPALVPNKSAHKQPVLAKRSKSSARTNYHQYPNFIHQNHNSPSVNGNKSPNPNFSASPGASGGPTTPGTGHGHPALFQFTPTQYSKFNQTHLPNPNTQKVSHKIHKVNVHSHAHNQTFNFTIQNPAPEFGAFNSSFDRENSGTNENPVFSPVGTGRATASGARFQNNQRNPPPPFRKERDEKPHKRKENLHKTIENDREHKTAGFSKRNLIENSEYSNFELMTQTQMDSFVNVPLGKNVEKKERERDLPRPPELDLSEKEKCFRVGTSSRLDNYANEFFLNNTEKIDNRALVREITTANATSPKVTLNLC